MEHIHYDGEFYTRIKSMRLSRHWSMEKLSEVSGISKATISRLENGGDAYISTIVILCKVFNCDLSDLVKIERFVPHL